uniref:Uncharacterized protein n=1 Tax=Ditylenchus dipsaci TaxID=166011 RepID=A0A915D3U8_9BILA
MNVFLTGWGESNGPRRNTTITIAAALSFGAKKEKKELLHWMEDFALCVCVQADWVVLLLLGCCLVVPDARPQREIFLLCYVLGGKGFVQMDEIIELNQIAGYSFICLFIYHLICVLTGWLASWMID